MLKSLFGEFINKTDKSKTLKSYFSDPTPAGGFEV